MPKHNNRVLTAPTPQTISDPQSISGVSFMKWGLLLSVLLFSAVGVAANSSKKSLMEMALAEAKFEGLQKSSATDAQVTGMLNLHDPRPEVVTRRWKYFAGFTLQNFNSAGYATKEGSGTFDLNNNDATVMPGLELGVMSPSMQTKAALWKLGLRGKASLASQEPTVKLATGYEVGDARLNTTMLSVGPAIALAWERLPWLSLTFSPQYGNLSYTQTSSNDFATFSKSAAYESMSYGVDIRLGPQWSVFTEWSQRNLKDDSEIALQKDNFELGTKVTW